MFYVRHRNAVNLPRRLLVEKVSWQCYIEFMLTKQDLIQIKKVVRDEVVSEGKNTKDELRTEIKLSRMQIQNDINGLANRVKNLELQTNETGKAIVKLQKDVTKIKKDVKFTANFLDREHLLLERRTKRIETHLGIQPLADF